MKKLFLIFIFFVFPSGYFFAKEMDYHALIQSTDESFDLEINDNLKVSVTLSGDLIKTNHRIMDKNINFQIHLYIQHNQLFHFKLINSEEAISKSFNAKFNKKMDWPTTIRKPIMSWIFCYQENVMKTPIK